VKISGGCSKAVVIDQDKCRSSYVDNVIISGLQNNKNKGINLPWDLEEDTCAIEVWAKDEW